MTLPSSQNGGPHARASSPRCGCSTLTTSAPSAARISVQYGPARELVTSTTRTPSSGRKSVTIRARPYEADGDFLSTYVLESDEQRAAHVEAHGYARPQSPKSYAFHLRELDDAPPDPNVPDGFRLHTVDGDEGFRKRVEIHRAVWAPSRVTEEVYRRVTQAWPYRADLDCVVEAPDGRFAAYVLGWYDDANRVGLFEPVGTHPDFRRLGLGSAVCQFALRRLREEGASLALVLAAEEPAMRLYESVGFHRYTRVVEFRKERA